MAEFRGYAASVHFKEDDEWYISGGTYNYETSDTTEVYQSSPDDFERTSAVLPREMDLHTMVAVNGSLAVVVCDNTLSNDFLIFNK